MATTSFTSFSDLLNSTYFATAAISLVVLVWAAAMTARKKSRLPLPPGPKGYPIIGNLLGKPPKYEWETYYQWTKDYQSDVVATKIFSTNIVILNTLDAAIGLLDKRSSNYSGRQGLESITLMGMNKWDIPVLPYGDFWRYCRKIIHQEFHIGATGLYYPHELKSTHTFLRSMLNSPEQLFKHVRHMVGETIISITYGIDVLPENDPYIAAAELQLEAGIKMITPPGFLVDFIPTLKYVPSWFPGAGFQQFMSDIKHASVEVMDKPMRITKEQMENNTQRGSFVSRSLDRRGNIQLGKLNDPGQYDRALRAASTSLYIAGSDTTRSTILSVILGLISNPEALRQAQKQIDDIVGRDRLPEITDRESIPWVTAIMYEALRWNPVTPFGLPHLSAADDEYKGLYIPGGSIVIANIWGMFHDENVYPASLQFKPERFLSSDMTLNSDALDPTAIAFGFGRRICPGRYMAQASVWVAIADLIAAFNISKAKDENGEYIEPSYKYNSAVISAPEPFAFSITPRDDTARQLVKDTIDFSYELV